MSSAATSGRGQRKKRRPGAPAAWNAIAFGENQLPVSGLTTVVAEPSATGTGALGAWAVA